jgi:hypothetical protein
MPNSITLQHPLLVSGFINGENNPSPGTSVSTGSVSGSIIQPYGGLLGGVLDIDATTAGKLTLPGSANTLLEGLYMMVQFLSSSTASNAVGQLVFWSNKSSYIVTPDVTAATTGKIAGVTLNAVTKGNYGFIQIAGRASVLFKGTITKTSPADGDLAIVDQTPANDADVLADATTITSPTLKAALGICYGAPTGGAISLVDLRFVGRNNF